MCCDGGVPKEGACCGAVGNCVCPGLYDGPPPLDGATVPHCCWDASPRKDVDGGAAFQGLPPATAPSGAYEGTPVGGRVASMESPPPDRDFPRVSSSSSPLARYSATRSRTARCRFVSPSVLDPSSNCGWVKYRFARVHEHNGIDAVRIHSRSSHNSTAVEVRYCSSCRVLVNRIIIQLTQSFDCARKFVCMATTNE